MAEGEDSSTKVLVEKLLREHGEAHGIRDIRVVRVQYHDEIEITTDEGIFRVSVKKFRLF